MTISIITSIIILLSLLILLLIGTPIAVAILISSLLGIIQSIGFNGALPASTLKVFQGINIFTLLAIPFFILAGNIMSKGGIAERLINFASVLTGKIPGSLAHTNIVANMLFGSVSGSGTAAASAMGSVLGPVQKEKDYDEDFSAAVNVSTAPTGLLIPPSTALITYALASGGTSVAALFLGGVVPGILWGISCIIVAYFIARKKGYVQTQKHSGSEILSVFIKAIPSLMLIIIIIGGIISGIFTATEASVMAVIYSVILSLFFYKTINLNELFNIFIDSAKLSAVIMFLVGTSGVLAWVMSYTQIPALLSNIMLGISENPLIILICINILLLIVGMFMDLTPAILIFTPILLPICVSLGMSPLQFGIMMTFNLSIGTITPPVGNILFVGLKISGRKLEKVLPYMVKFYVAIFVVLMLVTFIPALSEWLPSLVGYK